MTRDEIIDLLSLMAARDRRTIGETDVAAWLEDAGDLPFADARVAVSRHFRETGDWCMPFHIRKHVKAIRTERLANANQVIPPADPATWTRSLKEINRRIGDGQPTFQAIEGGDVQHAEDAKDYRKLREEWQAKRDLEAAQAKAEKEARISAAFAEQESRREADLAYSVIITLTDEESLTAYQLAREDLGPDATRERIMIRAAQLADHTKVRPAEEITDAIRDTTAKHCRHGCEYGTHEKPCPYADQDSRVGRDPEYRR
jgi:hypothetical protein